MFTKLIVIFTIILITIKLSEEAFTWCDAYETFCLFSYGTKVTVSNLTEAQEVCTKVNNNSWPIEITSQHFEDVLKIFLSNISLPSNVNVILNAALRNNEWYWIKNNLSFSVNNYIVDKNILSYGNSNKTTSSDETYAVVCTVECKAEWIHFDNSQVAGGHPCMEYQSYDECKYACETSRSYNCTVVDWNPNPDNHGCWISNDPNIANIKPGYKPGVSHDIINRTSKSVKQCIGQLKDGNSYEDSRTSNKTKTILLAVLLPILFLIIVVLIVIGVLHCKRKLNRSLASIGKEGDINTKCPRSDSLKYIDLNFEEEQQRQQETNIDSNNIGNTNVSFVVTGEPKRYNGPGGDAYTEVDKTFTNNMSGN